MRCSPRITVNAGGRQMFREAETNDASLRGLPEDFVAACTAAAPPIVVDTRNHNSRTRPLMIIERRTLLIGGLAALAATPARADTFPSKPIRFIVPYAAGGNVDVTVRLVGEAMSRNIGQAIVVANRPGAGGLVGQEATGNAPADGYTIVSAASRSLYVSALMAGKPSIVPLFQPLSMLSTVPMVVVVPANSRFADWQALMAEARAKPGSVSLGHAGNGTPNHTAILRLQGADKGTFAIAPYRGSGVGLNDVMAGQ